MCRNANPFRRNLQFFATISSVYCHCRYRVIQLVSSIHALRIADASVVSRKASSMSNSTEALATRPKAAWSETVAKYKNPNLFKSWWQVLNTFVPLAAMCGLMLLTYQWSYLLTLMLAVPTAGLLLRVFVLQHDCGHHSFFKTNEANDALGFICGVITLTPYHFWRRTHARHHATSGNLGHRGHGDVLTLTVGEYLAKSPGGRRCYQIYRHPLMMFLLGASYMFMVRQRFTHGLPKSWKRERKSIYLTNIAALGVLAVATVTIGFATFMALWFPVAVIAAGAGSWLFFVQHQFEDAYWEESKDWDFTTAALDGSSYYKLPCILQWFTGNIGFHQIHHLNSRIPNYNLSACYDEEPTLRNSPTITLWQSIRCASLKLWDEENQRLITFAQARVLEAMKSSNSPDDPEHSKRMAA
jgi:omega-6 fatty acid desaturase (delta-12 desaturase)